MSRVSKALLLGAFGLAGGASAIAQPEILQQPAYITPPTIQYPHLSFRLREQGTVIVRSFVRKDGSISQTEIEQSSGFSRLDSAAIAAFGNVRFHPTRAKDGEVAEGWVRTPIKFELK